MVQQSVERTVQSSYGLEHHGLREPGNVCWNLPTVALYEHVVRNREGLIAHLGPLVVRTGSHTGRSPNDKFIVRDTETEGQSGGGKLIARLNLRTLIICSCGCRPISRTETPMYRTVSLGLIHATGYPCASSPNGRGTACSRTRCSCDPRRMSCASLCRNSRSSIRRVFMPHPKLTGRCHHFHPDQLHP